VMLETMACGTPVIISDLPQIKGMINDAGKTVPYGDVDGLVGAIEKILRDSDHAATLGERGRERVVEEFSWEETVEQTTEQYRKLISM